MNKSILVVDDTRSMRKMVATVLQGAGYDVEEAADGAEALEKAKGRVFDLVVTDHNMPRMNGVTLVRSLRELATYDGVALIVLSTETGAELKVGDIHQTEPNIHAGTKYMDQLMTKYFPDAKFDPQNRALFAFASYNCGPGNVRKMRALAEKRGLNPDIWFDNVEVVTAEKIGRETTTYVRNIFKYYVAYKLALEMKETQDKARAQVKPGG